MPSPVFHLPKPGNASGYDGRTPREINLVEDFYEGLLEIQLFADAQRGKGRPLINAIMDFAYQIIASAPELIRLIQ